MTGVVEYIYIYTVDELVEEKGGYASDGVVGTQCKSV